MKITYRTLGAALTALAIAGPDLLRLGLGLGLVGIGRGRHIFHRST